MADLVSMAREVLRRQKKDTTAENIEAMREELEKCQGGRKVQVLVLLEKNHRMTSNELKEAMGLSIIGSNLTSYTKRLRDNFLIEIYNGSKFQRPEDVNYKFRYHSLTDFGLELIRDLGK